MNTETNGEGIVFKKTTGTYFVYSGGQIITCTASSKLHKQLVLPTASRASVKKQRVQAVLEVPVVDPIAIGDHVEFIESGDETGHITNVLPRHSYISRHAPGHEVREQIIAANVDQIFVVTAAWQPKPNWGMIDRYLAGAEACDVRAVLIITKMDVVRGRKHEKRLMEMVNIYRDIGYQVVLTSAPENSGIDEVRAKTKDKSTVVIGMSGVGKSTLLNAIQPDLGIAAKAINKKIDKGRHTTVHLEMFALDDGGSIIDTPGMKLFGLWDVMPDELDWLFLEIRPFVGQCKFGMDCSHTHEPDCVVKDMVEAGDISQQRYDSYVSIYNYITPEY